MSWQQELLVLGQWADRRRSAISDATSTLVRRTLMWRVTCAFLCLLQVTVDPRQTLAIFERLFCMVKLKAPLVLCPWCCDMPIDFLFKYH